MWPRVQLLALSHVPLQCSVSEPCTRALHTRPVPSRCSVSEPSRTVSRCSAVYQSPVHPSRTAPSRGAKAPPTPCPGRPDLHPSPRRTPGSATDSTARAVAAAMMNRKGMVAKILCRIRTDSFSSNYTLLGKELGRGKFAVVKKCMENATGKEYAAKFLRKRRKGQDCRMDIINEIAILEIAKSNSHVVDLHEVYETTSEIILVLEYAAGGEIFNQCVADRDEAFKEKDVVRLVCQILDGVAYLHGKNIVHLDIKPQNILLTSCNPLGNIRIVDFGLSRRVDTIEEIKEITGTPEYVAPEILNYEAISTATDMWSIGVLVYVMLTGTSPFLGDDKPSTYLNISKVDVDYSEDIFEGISDLALDFIQALLIKDPRKRAKAEQCLNHPWLNPETQVTKPLTESEEEQSESEPSTPDAEELVLMASYTLCRQLDKDVDIERTAVHKQFQFKEPFTTLRDFLSA